MKKTRTAIAATKPRDKNNNTPEDSQKEDDLIKTDTNTDDKDEDDQDLNNKDTEDDDPDLNNDAMTALEDIAAALQLEETATIDDVLAEITTLVTRNAELEDALKAANSDTGADTNSRRRYPNMFSGKSRDTNTRPLKGDKPNKTNKVKVAGKTRDVNTQDKALADHCQAAVDKEETKLGRSLSSGELSKVWRAATDNYIDKD